MKKIIYNLLIGACLTGSLASCDLTAEPNSSTEAAAVYSTYGLAEKAVMGIIVSMAETNAYRSRYIAYAGLNSDTELINGIQASNYTTDKYELCSYGATATNTEMNVSTNLWAKSYEGIERANLAITNLRKYGDISNNADMADLLGEALTLRAMLYFDLVKLWGDVPARFEPVTTETLYVPRSDRDTIYKQILGDLKEAEDYVYWPNQSTQTTSTERVSKSFVKGLRARIALFAGGYAQRADGTIRLSTDPDLERSKMYEIAKDECEDVINAGYNTLGTFKENFTKLCQDNVTAGGESLWELPFSDIRGRLVYYWGVKHQAADQYEGYGSMGGVNGPVPTLFYDYDVDDVRRDITCVPYQWSASSSAVQVLGDVKKWYFGKLRYEWMSRTVGNTTDDGINLQVMRMADVYLMAAEATNELSGPTDAAQYLEPILSRALPAAKVTAYMTTATASKDAFFNAIVDQRKLEFAGEFIRKFDLIRWNLLTTKLDEAKANMADLENQAGNYADLPNYLYYKYDTDGESLIVYGLDHGDTDAEGATLVSGSGYTQTTSKWITTGKFDDIISYLYTNSPDENEYWPIWQVFVDSSNGTLSNDWYK